MRTLFLALALAIAASHVQAQAPADGVEGAVIDAAPIGLMDPHKVLVADETVLSQEEEEEMMADLRATQVAQEDKLAAEEFMNEAELAVS